MFFSQAVNDRCAKQTLYAANTQQRITDSDDRVYTGQGGASSHISVAGSPAKGYVGHITVGVEL